MKAFKFIEKFFDRNKEQDKEQDTALKNASIAHGLNETVQRHGSAIAEDYIGYHGTRLNPDGTVTSYQKSHASIARSKINPEFSKQNIKQQAGFNAEVNHTVQKNKEAILAGRQERTSRTDDIRNPDGSFRTNDTVSDIVTLDSKGNIIVGSEGQMKFTNHPDKICDGIAGAGKEDLTRYQNKKLFLPSEQVGEAKAHCLEKAKELRKQAEYLESKKPELAQAKRQQADNYEKLSNSIEDAGFTREQAEAYRLNPKLETAKSIAKTAHDAGTQGAMYGAAIGGTISIASNIYAVWHGDKEVGDAVIDCTISTGKAAATGYATGAAGSALKGTMEQAHGLLVEQAIQKATAETGKNLSSKARNKVIEEVGKSTAGRMSKSLATLSKTNLPALAVTVCLEFGGIVRQYAKGEIDGVEFMEKAGEKGISLTASSMMATVGQVAIPIPVVGAVIGGMIGYTLSGLFYNEALAAFKGAKAAHENYLIVKARYEEAKRQRDIYRAHLREAFDAHMADQRSIIASAFQGIDIALENGNMSSFAENINSLGELFNKELRFKNREEFIEFMKSDEVFVL